MARIVEGIGCESASGSEDEFPSVQELLSTRGKRTPGTKVKSVSTGDKKGGARMRSLVKIDLKSGEVRRKEAEVVNGKDGMPKGLPKKRVLNQKSDNSLLRPFDGASSELLGEGSRRKVRGFGGVTGKKLSAKSVGEEAPAKQDGPKDGKSLAQRSGSELVESVESENENLFPVRSSKKGLKMARKLDLKAPEGKASTRSPSKLTKSVKADHPKFGSMRALDDYAGPGKEKSSKRFSAKETREGTEAGTYVPRSTPVESIVSEDEDLQQATKHTKSIQVRQPAEKTRASPPQRVESEEDFELDSDGLSDFIVDDSTFLDEEDTVIDEPAPRSVRKLVKGRRPARIDDSDDEELGLRMGKLKVEEDTSNSLDKALKELNLDDSDDEDLVETRRRKQIQPEVLGLPKNDQTQPASSDIEDPFTLRYSPSMNKPIKASKETRFATPPGSPVLNPRGLVSPKKKVPRIPSTPHRPSMDSFWQQDVVNDWNDEYSPRKVIPPQPQFKIEGSTPTDPSPASPRKSPVRRDQLLKETKKSFALRKHSLAEKFILELDTKVTNGEITKMSQATGGIRIIWSKTLNSTAGRANWKRETIRNSTNPHLSCYRHYANIELAEKVIDDENRLLNTIAHEFCHLTTFMIDNVKTNPHGKNFKAWGAKITEMFGNLGIEVTTKHSYAINYKYIWQCEKCGIEFKRHSKSIDPDRQRCGTCKSRLVQIKPAPKGSKGNAGKEKTLTEYQLFVKENMGKVKLANPGSPQKDIMSLVGKSYKKYKASKLNGRMGSVEMVDAMGGMESRQLTPEEDRAAFVSRKLDFLDLTNE